MSKVCKWGHDFTPENTRWNSDGSRGCRACLRAQSMRRYADNPEKKRERDRKRYADNLEKSRERNRRWRAENREKERERSRKWGVENPEKAREKSRRRRALKLDQLGYIPENWERTLFSLQRGRCLYAGVIPECLINLDLADRSSFHLDHMISLNDGGLHDHENTALACSPCNLRKHTKTAEEFFSGGSFWQ